MFLKLAFGPMFSGKTTWLVDQINHATPDCSLIINHKLDTRYSTQFLSSHDTISDLSCVFMDELMSLTPSFIANHELKNIFVNEAQFFDDLDSWLRSIQSCDVNVYVSGLDTDYNQLPFGKILACIPLADDITRLTSTCAICRKLARYTFRKNNDKNIIIVGNDNIYIPVCRICYFENNLN